MSQISGQLNVEIDVGGYEFPASASNILRFNIIESYNQSLPSIQLTLQDSTGDLVAALKSGGDVPVRTTVGDGGRQGEQSSNWSIQGQPDIKPGKGVFVVSFNGLLDNVPYVRKFASGLYEGTSNSVLSKIAGEVGLSFKGDSGSDNQVWLPNNKTIAGFAKSIERHAWAGNTSAFVTAVTAEADLLLKDLSKLTGGGEAFGLSGTPILAHEVHSLAAAGNHNRAAGSSTVTYDMEGVLQELNKVSSTFMGNILGFTDKFQKDIGDFGSRLDSVIRSAGNTHEKYIEAKHQNQRLRSMFSNDVRMLVDTFSGKQMLDPVTVLLPNLVSPNYNASQLNTNLSGNYVLSSKITAIKGTQYFEKLIATNQG